MTNKNNNQAIFYLDKDDRHLNVQLEAVEQHIIVSVRRSDDITLVTSLDRGTRSKSVENILKKYKSEIRTFTLGSEFFKNDSEGDSASITDLVDMTDVILGSTHSEKFFVVLIEDADDLQTSDLDELAGVVQTLNQENNHAGILMVCDPAFVKSIKEANGVSDLKVSECSLDRISQDDIQNFIDERQKDSERSEQLEFDASALKIITTHATGSLYEASILLEWCRVYAQHQNILQLNSELINQMFSVLLKASPKAGTNLITDYPPVDFEFDDTSSHEAQKPFFPTTDADDIKDDTGDGSNEISSSGNAIQDEQNIPTLKSESLEVAIDNLPATDEDQGEDQNLPETSGEDTHKINKRPLGWILIILLLALGLYYLLPVPDQPVPVTDNPVTNKDEQRQSAQPTPADPTPTMPAEAFEELAIPEEQPIVAADPEYDTQPPETLQIESDDRPYEAHVQPAEPDLPEPQSETGEVLPATVEQASPELEENNETTLPETADSESDDVEPQTDDTLNDQSRATNDALTDKSERAIDVLLEIADQQFNNKRLTTPDSGNAFNTYQLVLEIDPENEDAKAGLVGIVDRYKEWINTDIEDENYTRARVFLNRAFRVAPDDPELKRLQVVVDRNS